MPDNTLAIRLREARLMRGLSMDKLIELADFVVTKQSLSRYERGIMRPHANVISALAKALDISEDYFLGTSSTCPCSAPHREASCKRMFSRR